MIFQRQRLFDERYRLSHSRVNVKDRKGSETRSRDVMSGPGDGGNEIYVWECFTTSPTLHEKHSRRLTDDFSLTNFHCELSSHEITKMSRRPSFAFFRLRSISACDAHKLELSIKTLLPALVPAIYSARLQMSNVRGGKISKFSASFENPLAWKFCLSFSPSREYFSKSQFA